MMQTVVRRRLGRVNDRLVWIDCEMTGLDLERDALIEVAVLVTDSELNILGEGVDIVIRPPQEALVTMPEVVREMHTASGLLDELADGVTLAEAEAKVLDYVRQWAPEAGKTPLAGNSVATDRGFLARDMPALEGHLHYRIVDVSSIKELARRWYPRAYYNSPQKGKPPGAGGHSGEHRRTAVLPGGGVRPGAGPGDRARPGDRGEAPDHHRLTDRVRRRRAAVVSCATRPSRRSRPWRGSSAFGVPPAGRPRETLARAPSRIL